MHCIQNSTYFLFTERNEMSERKIKPTMYNDKCRMS